MSSFNLENMEKIIPFDEGMRPVVNFLADQFEGASDESLENAQTYLSDYVAEFSGRKEGLDLAYAAGGVRVQLEDWGEKYGVAGKGATINLVDWQRQPIELRPKYDLLREIYEAKREGDRVKISRALDRCVVIGEGFADLDSAKFVAMLDKLFEGEEMDANLIDEVMRERGMHLGHLIGGEFGETRWSGQMTINGKNLIDKAMHLGSGINGAPYVPTSLWEPQSSVQIGFRMPHKGNAVAFVATRNLNFLERLTPLSDHMDVGKSPHGLYAYHAALEGGSEEEMTFSGYKLPVYTMGIVDEAQLGKSRGIHVKLGTRNLEAQMWGSRLISDEKFKAEEAKRKSYEGNRSGIIATP